MRRTKIVCTIGPASSSPRIMEGLIKTGMDMARLNFSYGTPEEQRRRIKTLREISAKLNRPLAVLADFQGLKIRIGELASGKVFLRKGNYLALTAEPKVGNENEIFVDYPRLATDVRVGERIFLNEGLIQLVAVEVNESRVKCRILIGGELESGKKVNLPDTKITAPIFTPKDRSDLAQILKEEVDFVALSFVKEAQDITDLRALIPEVNREIKVVAKIEKAWAIKSIDDIIEVADVVMVARGDLGAELPPEDLPLLQKEIIRKCNRAGKPVITATQMLKSMVNSPQPTRAETSDVANAIFDGTDALMLSEEVAVGNFPVQSVQTMVKIATKAESGLDYLKVPKERSDPVTPTEAISSAACDLATSLKAKAIITPTQSGFTARSVSRHRPPVPIVAVSPSPIVVRQLMLSWGVIPLLTDPSKKVDEVLEKAVRKAEEAGIVAKGDKVVITAGILVDVPGTTNFIKVHTV